MKYFNILYVLCIVGGNSEIIHKPAMTDDPQRRKPDITRAKKYIGWQPKVYFRLFEEHS